MKGTLVSLTPDKADYASSFCDVIGQGLSAVPSYDSGWSSFESCRTADTGESCQHRSGQDIDIQDIDWCKVKIEVEKSSSPEFSSHSADSSQNVRQTHKKLLIQSTLSFFEIYRQCVCDDFDIESQTAPLVVECPLCLWECKNYPDRLLHLLDHIHEHHEAVLDPTVEFIFERYQSLVSSMMGEVLKQISSL